SQPVASYTGDVASLPATSPRVTGVRNLDVETASAKSYRKRLAAERARALTTAERVCGRQIVPVCEYDVAFHGLAVSLSPKEAALVARAPGVASVRRERLYYLNTDAGPEWIAAPTVWAGGALPPSKGEGVVVGVIDTGINPWNPSFADIGGDGYDHANPRGRYYGVGDPGNPNYDAAFPVNDKLIGAYDFLPLSDVSVPYDPLDIHGHGSHTASIAAGNVVDPAVAKSPTATIPRKISGVAPHANLISYKVVFPSGYATETSILAAIDQAVADRVDALNVSLGGGPMDPWEDAASLAFLNARAAGILVATSAGNSGPDAQTIGSPANAPWVLAVGACTHHRRFLASVENLTRDGGDALPDLPGAGITGAYGPVRIVYAGDYANPEDPFDLPGLCLLPFPPGTFRGEIVVCDAGWVPSAWKSENLAAGGAGGMVLANGPLDGDTVYTEVHEIPALNISFSDGGALKNWLSSGSNHRAAIGGTRVDLRPANGDVVAAFSSRGANPPILSVLKPDVVAPGVDILAASTDIEYEGGGRGDGRIWEIMSGTSMASPHGAGAAALLNALHPDWSPAEIQSALTMTAVTTLKKEDGLTTADSFDVGGGRIDVALASRAGIVLDETRADFLSASPFHGGDPASLNLASLVQVEIAEATWKRTVRSVAGWSEDWTVAADEPQKVALSVNPASFTLAPGGTREITVTADLTSVPRSEYYQWRFGRINLTPHTRLLADAHFPLAVRKIPSNLPERVRIRDARPAGTKTIENVRAILIFDLRSKRHGLVAADVHEEDLYQDPTPLSPVDYWPPDPESGVAAFYHEVPSGAKRLVAEILESTATDMDLYVLRQEGEDYKLVCWSISLTSDEYCSLSDPTPGAYLFIVQNYEASNSMGWRPDSVALAVGIVPYPDSHNLSVHESSDRITIPGGEPFNLDIDWNITDPGTHFYGAFSLGADSFNPALLGTVAMDLHLAEPARTATPTPTVGPTPTPEPIQGLIESFYRLILGREAEPGAVDAWQHGYFDYAVGFDIDVRFVPREMARIFFLSDEYAARQRTNAEFIEDCYQAFLNRSPNPAELQDWLGGAWNRAQVMTVFSESQEFADRIAAMYPSRVGNRTKNFVTTLYIGLLDRLVDQGGLAHFAGLFDQSQDKRALAKWMAREVIASEEFLAKKPTTEDHVVRLYRAFLGRFPNDSEIAVWKAEIEAGRQTPNSLIDLFGDAPEFSQRLQDYFAP
ncbi:MAG TPA: S8 family serine peptidase, partial [Sumerlaeia bacterium]|nr:S8 family serine peptidase [Sumerlaeia bacterium]